MTQGSATSSDARNAGLYLDHLLRTTYRTKWDRVTWVGRSRTADVHRTAVAHVLVDYLQFCPREGHPTDRDVEARQLLPLVSRAIQGKNLSRETLELFISAFSMSDEHANQLRRQWDGTDPARVVIRDLPPIAEPATGPAPEYYVVSLHEFHYLGPEGQPTHHRTICDIEALRDGLASYRYQYDASCLSVERILGGTPGQQHQVTGDRWAVDIRLPRVLARGQTHTLEFMTRFVDPHFTEACFRRAAHRRYENVSIWVGFHADKQPRTVWWSEWQDYREPNIVVTHDDEVTLDDDCAVFRHLAELDRAVVGFRWEW
jgi:hypothetical protein